MTNLSERAFVSFLTLATTFFWSSIGLALHHGKVGVAIVCAVIATVSTLLTLVVIVGDD